MFQKKPRKPRRGEANIRLLELNRVVRLLKVIVFGGFGEYWGWLYVWMSLEEGLIWGMLGAAARGGV